MNKGELNTCISLYCRAIIKYNIVWVVKSQVDVWELGPSESIDIYFWDMVEVLGGVYFLNSAPRQIITESAN